MALDLNVYVWRDRDLYIVWNVAFHKMKFWPEISNVYVSRDKRLKNITLFEMLCIMKFWNFAPRCLWQIWTITLYYILHACLKSRKEEQRWSAILYLIPQYHTECQAVECFKQFFVYLFYNIHRCCIWAIDGWLAHWPICELLVYTCSVWLAPLHTSTIVIHHMQDWTSAFYLLMSCCFLSAMVSTRISSWIKPWGGSVVNILFQAGMASSFKRWKWLKCMVIK